MFLAQNVDALPLASYATDPPISFTYGGKPSAELMKTWKAERASKKISKSRTQQTVIYTDSATGLQVKLVTVAYADFPTAEWTAYFKNTGKADTPILENVKALDISFQRAKPGEFVLHHQRGTTVQANDFEPLATTLAPGSKTEFVPNGGRPTGGNWPYYNLEFDNGGALIVVSWQGYWSADFDRDSDKGLAIRAGQQTTHLKLHAGEQIRTPLIVIQNYKGDWVDAQNVWRKWMAAYNIPRIRGGKLPPPQFNACSSHQFAEMINANEENQKLFVDRFAEEKLGLDYWWMDAGWYPCDGSWPKTGTWEVDKTRFPNGLRPISDEAHSKGIKTIVWFEPERVAGGTWLYDKHRSGCSSRRRRARPC
jgi:alpha-galactosidase